MTKFFIDQHGCAKNQVDGELIISRLSNKGMEQTFDPSKADIIIINSCGFIESAKKESINAVIAAKQHYPDAKILLTGCLAERYADILKDSLTEADGFFGNGDISRIDAVIEQLSAGKRPILLPEQKEICCGGRTMMLSYRGSAYVKITEGCNNFCSFCAIPLIRGKLRSRSADNIVNEIQELTDNGVYEINLIGQDLAAYGTGDNDDVFGNGRFMLPYIDENGVNCGTEKKSALSLLLERISSIKGEFVVRLLYIHPDHFNRDILPVMQHDTRLLPYFDIPFQSGDDRLIHLMNRKGSGGEYQRLVHDIRAAFPHMALRTTFLTGFPGENCEAAENTQQFLRTIRSDWSGCFPYSREENTPAYTMKERVTQKTAKERAQVLETIQSGITKECLAARCGKEFNVLVEELIKGEEEGLAIGRAWFQAPEVDGSIVIRYDIDDETQRTAVQPGHVIRVYADSSSEVDIDAHFVSDLPVNNKLNKSSLQYAPEQEQEGQ
ncbi:MAG: 30S ribosomal protein S12 methylthiotransferase RimO [Treponema sp.]|nr:30S ribosomal protein S12 methylthiotransferase RimO [Treponema sp.]